MEWLQAALIFVGFLILLASGMPIAFCFALIVLVGAFFLFGGTPGIEQTILGNYRSVAAFRLLPIPLFILMGEILFGTNIAYDIIDVLDKWMGRMPGRLSLLAVASGTLLSVLSGASAASVATLGRSLVPEMEKQGYHKTMSVGAILGSGGLAVMIPPSGLAIVVGAIAEVSIGRILIGGIIPGLLMAVTFAIYIITACTLRPSMAPSYDVVPSPLSQKLIGTVKYLLPVAFIIFMVTGVILLGIATPSEAAACGTIAAIIVAIAYKRWNFSRLKQITANTLMTTGMIFLIIAGSQVFSSLMAFTGTVRQMAQFALGMESGVAFIIFMMVLALILGCFMSAIAIMMILLPVCMPVVQALGYDPVWFGVLFLINMEMSFVTPPFGLSLFVMKTVAPTSVTMKDVFISGIPYLICELLVMVLVIAFPAIALWLPGLMM